jgi:hypothetical protein
MGAKLKTVLGVIWAAPLTLIALLYVGLFTALRWYSYHGISHDALVFLTNKSRMPKPLANSWANWGGHAIGNVIVLNVEPGARRFETLLKHESVHVAQCMRGGVFAAIAYPLCMLFIKWMCIASDAYYSNPFEIDARRAAGQTVDVEGVLTKAVLEGKVKK